MASIQKEQPSNALSPIDSVVDDTRNRINRPIFLRSIFIIRLINAWWIATFFQPDEYFQSLEPAWDLAFGSSSGAWLTWVPYAFASLSWLHCAANSFAQEWKYQLRSSLHPALFSGVYLVAGFLSSLLLPVGSILRASVLVAAPGFLQAGIAALGDWFTWQLAVVIFGPNSNVSFFTVSHPLS